MEGGGVTTKVTEESATNKMSSKELFTEGKIKEDLLKYLPKQEDYACKNTKTEKLTTKKSWNSLRYKSEDGYIVCGQCRSKIGCNRICGDCFVKIV